MTLWQTAHLLGLKQGVHYHYQAQEGLIRLSNGSVMFLKALSYQPSDPDYTRLGGLEITDAFIDEAAELPALAARMVASRIRQGLDIVKGPPKLLLCSNPARCWLYHEFYQPAKQGQLPTHRRFVQALVQDNLTEGFAAHYAAQLALLDPVQKMRLLEGMWDYAEDSLQLFKMEDLSLLPSLFRTDGREKRYLTADIARFGQDKTVIGIWQGLQLSDIQIIDHAPLTEVAAAIRQWMQTLAIAPAAVVIDCDGIGGGVADMLPGVRQFQAQAKPIALGKDTPRYQHLKAQCYYHLAQNIAQREIGINPDLQAKSLHGTGLLQALSEELIAIRRKEDADTSAWAINSKDQQKRLLGRSPDLADMLMLRLLFELKPTAFVFQ